MKIVFKGILLSCALLVLTGCGGIVGQWRVMSVEPESAKGEFGVCCVCFGADGTFKACSHEGDEPAVHTGTYEYDKKAQTLACSSEGEKCCTLQAELSGFLAQNTLILRHTCEDEKQWTATLKRCACKGTKDCCGSCCCCCAKCAGKCPSDCAGKCGGKCTEKCTAKE